MTLQWTAVALFLYAEIAVNLFLCIPFISPQRWRLVFGWRIWSWLSPYWNRCFFTMIVALVILFVDAVREVQKYSNPENTEDAKVNPNIYDHVHMKLFRAQRNLYICGFSLFLWLITRRVVTLINMAAVTMEISAGLRAEVEHAVAAAEEHQENLRTLQQAVQEGEKSSSAHQGVMSLQLEQLKAELRAAEQSVHRSQAEVEGMKRQSKGLAQEYERLLSEHQQLQQNQQTPAEKKKQ